MTGTSEPKIQASGLTVKYGPVTAVDCLSLSVAPGEVLGILGGNGAGKSSSLRAFAGVNPPTSGDLRIAGFDMSVPGEAEKARWMIGYCPDVGGLVRQSTVREHIGVALASRDALENWPHAMKLLESFDLVDVLDRETLGFSHGMSRRLSVLLAAVTATEVLILDEPFDGVDPMGVHATERVIQLAKESGVSVIVSTHLLSLLTGVSDRIAVMLKGTVIETGSIDNYTGLAGVNHYEDLLMHNAARAAV